jgi:pimeloyl-ACP methyl ester carboxylesterase
VAKGWAFVQRIFTRTEDRDVDTALGTRDAQLDAISASGIRDSSRRNRLAGITQPVLVANGDNDRMVPTEEHAPARRPTTRRAAEDLPPRPATASSSSTRSSSPEKLRRSSPNRAPARRCTTKLRRSR